MTPTAVRECAWISPQAVLIDIQCEGGKAVHETEAIQGQLSFSGKENWQSSLIVSACFQLVSMRQECFSAVMAARRRAAMFNKKDG